jgi:hypothetical protein
VVAVVIWCERSLRGEKERRELNLIGVDTKLSSDQCAQAVLDLPVSGNRGAAGIGRVFVDIVPLAMSGETTPGALEFSHELAALHISISTSFVTASAWTVDDWSASISS